MKGSIIRLSCATHSNVNTPYTTANAVKMPCSIAVVAVMGYSYMANSVRWEHEQLAVNEYDDDEENGDDAHQAPDSVVGRDGVVAVNKARNDWEEEEEDKEEPDGETEEATSVPSLVGTYSVSDMVTLL